ncbi:MAG: M23 family metallopeptidase [Clostridia bacterium]|nr:M23 family metallopeptidase [Clostridia bacterium]
MDFILLNWIKYYTRGIFKTIRNILFATTLILIVVAIKYKPAYEVTMTGESLGFISNKEVMEAKIKKYMDDTSNNIAFREIEDMPEYSLKLVNRDVEESSKKIMQIVDSKTTTTYKVYAITSNGEEKLSVSSVPEAEEIINKTKEGLDSNVDLALGIADKYTTDLNLTSKDVAIAELGTFKEQKVAEYKEKKAAEAKAERERIAKEKAKKYNASLAASIASTTTSAPSGNLNGMSLSIPVSGSISSRFGARSSIRSSVHTGLDIASPMGTGFRPIAAGTVTFAASNGSYGNLIKVSHGNGVESWYAHCSSIYVNVGQAVDTSTTIGAVGSTGNSTGPHLHLEIRIGGSPVNPQNYLYK